MSIKSIVVQGYLPSTCPKDGKGESKIDEVINRLIKEKNIKKILFSPKILDIRKGMEATLIIEMLIFYESEDDLSPDPSTLQS